MQKLFLVLALTALVFVGSSQAQVSDLPDPGLLPNSPFYFLKRFTERIGTFLTFGEVARAQRMLDISEKRLAEAGALAARGLPEVAERTLQNYQEYLNQAVERAETAKARGFDVDNVLERVAGATLRHQAVLAEVYEKVPEQAKPAIERAMQAGLRGHEEALRAVSSQKQEEVLERVEQKRDEVKQRLEELRQEGIPMPAIPLPTRGQIRERIRVAPEEAGVPVQNQSDFRTQEQERIQRQERAIEREMEQLIREPMPLFEAPGAPGVRPGVPRTIPGR